MRFAAAEKIADAVLFEGYMLYPYRPSALKNRQRWNFGTLFARAFALAQNPPEPCSFRTEVLFESDPSARIDVRLRFMQLVPQPGGDAQSWDIGVVRARDAEGLALGELSHSAAFEFDFTTLSEEEKRRAPSAFAARPCIARIECRAIQIEDRLHRLAIAVSNETPSIETASRREMQAVAFTSAHLLLGVSGGAFVSLLDPPPALAAAAATCANQGVYPVLAGADDDRDLMLCSPIVLYDHPQIAPESAGDFFDGTEMDEMLALRVLTLTDEEKREMRQSDPHARAILDRVEAMGGGDLLKIHGANRGASEFPDSAIEPWNPFDEKPAIEAVQVSGVELRKGDRVRLWPQKRADILDAAMEGRIAIIEAVEQDLEGSVQLAVVLEDDPGKDMGLLRQSGHRFFFSPNEVEPLAMKAPR